MKMWVSPEHNCLIVLHTNRKVYLQLSDDDMQLKGRKKQKKKIYGKHILQNITKIWLFIAPVVLEDK